MIRSHQGQDSPADARGFTIIEVLVSLILLTVGLFGMAQLFLLSEVTSRNSIHRTLAEVQAVDMGERMWLNLDDPMSGVSHWETLHAGTLPDWNGEVQVVGDPHEGVYRIRVSWSQRRLAGQGPSFFDHYVRLPRVE